MGTCPMVTGAVPHVVGPILPGPGAAVLPGWYRNRRQGGLDPVRPAIDRAQ
jgi:hypothetical protein